MIPSSFKNETISGIDVEIAFFNKTKNVRLTPDPADLNKATTEELMGFWTAINDYVVRFLKANPGWSFDGDLDDESDFRAAQIFES